MKIVTMLPLLLALLIPIRAADADEDPGEMANKAMELYEDPATRPQALALYHKALGKAVGKVRIEILKNLGKAYGAMNAYAEAFPYLHFAFLSEGGTDLKIRDALEFVRKKLSGDHVQVRIETDPTRSVVTFPGEAGPHRFRTPATWWFRPGTYSIQVTHDGYHPKEETLVVKAGKAPTVKVVLAAKEIAKPVKDPDAPPPRGRPFRPEARKTRRPQDPCLEVGAPGHGPGHGRGRRRDVDGRLGPRQRPQRRVQRPVRAGPGGGPAGAVRSALEGRGGPAPAHLLRPLGGRRRGRDHGPGPDPHRRPGADAADAGGGPRGGSAGASRGLGRRGRPPPRAAVPGGDPMKRMTTTLLLVTLVAAGCIEKTASIIADPELAKADTVTGGDAIPDAPADVPGTDATDAADTATPGDTLLDAVADLADAPTPDVPVDTPVDTPADTPPDTPPDTPDPCADAVCGDGACDAACEDGLSCPDDCCECGDLHCDLYCGEWAASCAVDCCICGDDKCSISPCGEDALTCTDDCWMFVCGNGTCDPGENPIDCPWDCGNAACGNGECEPGEGPVTCPFDCTPFACGNHVCEEGENPAVCPIDCSQKCGDCLCDPDENWLKCPEDCGWCGDAHCASSCGAEGFGTCPQDCCVDGNPCTEDVFTVVDEEVVCTFKPLTGTACDTNCQEGADGTCDDGICVCP